MKVSSNFLYKAFSSLFNTLVFLGVGRTTGGSGCLGPGSIVKSFVDTRAFGLGVGVTIVSSTTASGLVSTITGVSTTLGVSFLGVVVFFVVDFVVAFLVVDFVVAFLVVDFAVNVYC